ncbi:MAG: hypothetical protein JXA54_04290 [Candidatus Heimdallarchaeota archaeon]|nr:hypothetical protein [Candidatus Heimdallarchaeota archaeon]
MSKIDKIIENSLDKLSKVYLEKNAIFGVLTSTNFYLHTKDIPNAIEKVIADTALLFEKISRIEISLITGFSLPVIDFELERMSVEGYLIHIDYFDKNKLNTNLSKIRKDLKDKIIDEENYFELNKLLESYYIKQYKLTDKGIFLAKNNQKNSLEFNEELICYLVLVDDSFWLIEKENETKYLPGGDKITIGPEYYPSIEKFLQSNSKIILGSNHAFDNLTETSNITLYENKKCKVWISERNYSNPSFLLTNGSKIVSYNFHGSITFTQFPINALEKLLMDHIYNELNGKEIIFVKNTNLPCCLLKIELYNEHLIDNLAKIKPDYFTKLYSDDIEFNFNDGIYLTRYQIAPFLRSKESCLCFCYQYLKTKFSNEQIIGEKNLIENCKSSIVEISNLIKEKIPINLNELLEYLRIRETSSPNRTIFIFEDELEIEVKTKLSNLGINKFNFEIFEFNENIIAICTLNNEFEKIKDLMIKNSSFFERGNTKAIYDFYLIPDNNSENKLNFIGGLLSSSLNGKLTSKESLKKLTMEKEQELNQLMQYIKKNIPKNPDDYYTKLIQFLRKKAKVDFYIVEEEGDKIVNDLISKGFENSATIESLNVKDNSIETVISISNALFEKYTVNKLPNILQNISLNQTFDNFPEEQELRIDFSFIIKDGSITSFTKLLAMHLGGKFHKQIASNKEIKEFYSNNVNLLNNISNKYNINNSDVLSKLNWKDCLNLAKDKYNILIKEDEITKKIKFQFPNLSEEKIIIIEDIGNLVANVILDDEMISSSINIKLIKKSSSQVNVNLNNKNLDFAFNLITHPLDKKSLEILSIIRSSLIIENKLMSIKNGINTMKSIAGEIYQKAIEFNSLLEKLDLEDSDIEIKIREYINKDKIFIDDYIFHKVSNDFPKSNFIIKILSGENFVASIIQFSEIEKYYNNENIKESFLGYTQHEITANDKNRIKYKLTLLPEIFSTKDSQKFISMIVSESVKNQLLTKNDITLIADDKFTELITRMNFFDINLEKLDVTEKWLLPLLKEQLNNALLIKEDVVNSRFKIIFGKVFNNKKFDYTDDEIIVPINRREIASFVKNEMESLLDLDLKIPYLEDDNKNTFLVKYVVNSIRDFKELLNIRFKQYPDIANTVEKTKLFNELFNATLEQSILSDKDKEIVKKEREVY